jgi:polysaccharide biosynthesis transport protein
VKSSGRLTKERVKMIPLLEREDEYKCPVPVSESRVLSPEIRDVLLHYDTTPSFSDFLEILLRRKIAIVGVFFLFVIPALICNLMIKPVYQASGSIEIYPNPLKVTKFDSMTIDNSMPRQGGYFETQMELLKSPSLARRVIQRLDLGSEVGFNPDLEEKNEKKPIWRVANYIKNFKGVTIGAVSKLFQPVTDHIETSGAEDPGNSESDLRWLEGVFSGKLNLEMKGETSILEIKFDSTDPRMAANVVNSIIDEYINWDMDRKIDAAKSAKQQLDKQIKLARAEMDKSEAEKNRYAKEKGIVSLDSRLNSIYQQLEQINDALAKAEAERIGKEEFYRFTVSSDISSSPLVLQNTLIQALRQQYIELMGDYEKLRTSFKDDYPTVKNLRAKMVDVGKRIDVEQQRLLNSFKNDYQATLNREKALQTTAEEKKFLALQLNDNASRYKTLEREVEINNQIFQSLLERSKEIDANVGTELGNIKIVDLATSPMRPSKPRIMRNVLLACALGLMGGIGLALFSELVDKTVRRVDEISDRHMIRILGVLPFVAKEEAKAIDFIVRKSPASLFSEAVRAAKASVHFACNGLTGQRVSSLLITGTTAGEGKTTIAANLAQAYAAAGERVLVMDADLRRPRLGKTFTENMTNGSYGLSHYLNGVCELDQIIRETNIPNLSIISSGPASSRLAELLASSRMKGMLDSLSQEFDRVILDSPPFGVFADVLILAGQVDAVILVTALGRTHREDVRVFRRKLNEAKGFLLGSIVNKLDLSRYNGGYHQKHYRSYYSMKVRKGSNLPAEIDLDQ